MGLRIPRPFKFPLVCHWAFAQLRTAFAPGDITVVVEVHVRVLSQPVPCLGTLDVSNVNCTPMASFFTCLSLNAGAFPGGYWFGIEPLTFELIDQFNTPALPFRGFLDAAGQSSWTAILPAGPIGVTVYGVTRETTGFLFATGTAPVSASL